MSDTPPPAAEGGRLIFRSEVFAPAPRTPRPPTGQVVHETARDIPVHATCDVLVAGGGPAGTMAAVAAARRGAREIGRASCRERV